MQVKITGKDGTVFEVSDLTLDDIRSLIGTQKPNGNGNGTRHLAGSAEVLRQPDYKAFSAALSDHGKKFLQVLRDHRQGINADALCEAMGFTSTNQIGGVTGGGIRKLTEKFHVKTTDLYTVQKKFERGQRIVIFAPGPQIEKVL